MKPWIIVYSSHSHSLFIEFFFIEIGNSSHICLIVVILGARFEFVLDEELKMAAAHEDVKAALGAKISRERIGTEVC